MPIPSDQLAPLCLKWANGNKPAADFLHTWAQIVRRADDIADGDSADPVGDMGALLVQCLVDVSGNPFFQANAPTLSVAMANAIALWVKSEEWRTSLNRKTRMFGFIGRETCEHVTYAVALMTGGYAHQLAVIEDIQSISHKTSPEQFEAWEKEIR